MDNKVIDFFLKRGYFYIMAEQCPSCKGLGYHSKVDFIKARTIKEPCKDCQGTGQVIQKQTDGIRCGEIIAKSYVWQELKDNHIIAKLEIRIWPIMKDGKMVTVRPNPLSPGVVPLVYIELMRFKTNSAFRKQGIMHRLFTHAFADPKVMWAICPLEEMTKDGRAFLEKMGFIIENEMMIRRKDETAFGDDKPDGVEDPEDADKDDAARAAGLEE